MREAPRCTKFLRVHWPEEAVGRDRNQAAHALDELDALFLARKVWLDEHEVGVSREQDQELSWEIFIRPLTIHDVQRRSDYHHGLEKQMKEHRQKFQGWMNLICEKIVGENDGSVGMIAYMIYDEVVARKGIAQKVMDLGAKGPSVKMRVEKMLDRSIEPNAWKETIQTITELLEWRQSMRTDLGIEESAVDFEQLIGYNIPYNTTSEEIQKDSMEEYLSGVCVDPTRSMAHVKTDVEKKAVAGRPVAMQPLWLIERCATHTAMTNSAFSPLELAKSIVATFKNTSALDMLPGALFDILGMEGFDMIQSMIDNKDAIQTFSDASLELAVFEAEEGGPMRSSLNAPPVVGPSITVQTENEKKLQRKRQKDARREQRRAGPMDVEASENNLDWLQNVGFDAEYLRQERALGLQGGGKFHQEPLSALKEAFGMLEGGFEYHGTSKRALPEGTTRTHFKGYEKVNIPPPRVKPITKDGLVSIEASMDSFCHAVFAGITHLNRLQSEVFTCAYGTSENMLVCAPTGAGKTNVAMMTILHEVKKHIHENGGGGVVHDASFKIIYVAPMKALAAEVVDRFSKRLRPLKIRVAELTGDMQMTRAEMDSTHVIVTTPEKWDVITRKSNDGTLVEQVRLLIIDEVHLLADGRGSVIEILVARTLRLVESRQSMIRIVGLSATLPNYKDVGSFLRVNPTKGLFYFDGSYRPVPLTQTFIGVTEKNRFKQTLLMNEIAYEEALDSIERGHQVMIFVHSRKDTAGTIRSLMEMAAAKGSLDTFSSCHTNDAFTSFKMDVQKSRNKDVREFFESGFGIHHAGMLRSDRTLTERMFVAGVLKVLCCTATLAWGVNLPAHTVLIKGTQVYNAEKGGLMPLSMLDVMQIFGRAGRPQYDTYGEATMITTHTELPHYLGLLSAQMPIESSLIKALPDHLNAEIVSGTVTNLREASIWLSYTYLYVRMLQNPMVYGITYEEKALDPALSEKRKNLLELAAQQLDDCRMIRYDKRSGNFAVTNLGRVASHYYVCSKSIDTFNELLSEHASDADLFHVICSSEEFVQLKVRDEELKELEKLEKQACRLEVKSGLATPAGKASVLLQAYLSRARSTGFTIISDGNYVVQNAGRVARALFEICLKKGWSSVASCLLSIAKSIDQSLWWFQSPLRQFASLPVDVLTKLENRHATIEKLRDMNAKEIGDLINNFHMSSKIKNFVEQLPYLEIGATIQPITRGIIQMTVELTAKFQWHDKTHAQTEPFWIWVEDSENEHIYHSEYYILHKSKARETQTLSFTLPIFHPLPSQYVVCVCSDRWVGVDLRHAVSFQHLILPDDHPPHTDLLNLHPLPKEALRNAAFESLYSFQHFNPIQTQIFHSVYHTDRNVLLGAPTGSGKTIASELAIFQVWNNHPVAETAKVVYIAPLKALSRERMKDWKQKFESKLGKRVVEMTGDTTPDVAAIQKAAILITTPEKWDGITRGWRQRNYVKDVRLVIIDEIHLLGEDRGPILEVIVSRMRFIASTMSTHCRIVGLSTALANAQDLASWLGIDSLGLFNFRPSVRPIPMEVHIQGFPGKHYCPRMASMNKPAFAAIQEHSMHKPVLIFVSSRRQTRLTALDLISFCASASDPRQFLHLPPGTNEDMEIETLVEAVRDEALKHTLQFGIGIHHAGLAESDRELVEELFCKGHIQILVCTSTLAWGVNFPAHLVIVKGTEFFDGKVGRYVDFPITDVLQMMGRAGRPQFDTSGIACILVHEPKKNFYRKFLYEPFPVESSLHEKLHNHFNAEIAGGSMTNKQDAIDYLTWTYFYRRLVKNPSYYGLTNDTSMEAFLLDLVDKVLRDLETSLCIEIMDDEFEVRSTALGWIASFYYLDHASVKLISETVAGKNTSLLCQGYQGILQLLCNVSEFKDLPVRHNEEKLNAELAEQVRWPVVPKLQPFESAHTKAFLLLQAHLGRQKLPISDYITDTKSVLDQIPRVANAMIDIVAEKGTLDMALQMTQLVQMLAQGFYLDQVSELRQLPHFTHLVVDMFEKQGISTLKQLMECDESIVQMVLKRQKIPSQQLQQTLQCISNLPRIDLQWKWKHLETQTDAGIRRLEISVMALNKKIQESVYISSPNVSKTKRFGFWIIVGSNRTNELLAMKRISYRKNQTVSLDVSLSAEEYQQKKHLTLYLASDVIKGLDQTLELTYE